MANVSADAEAPKVRVFGQRSHLCCEEIYTFRRFDNNSSPLKRVAQREHHVISHTRRDLCCIDVFGS